MHNHININVKNNQAKVVSRFFSFFFSKNLWYIKKNYYNWGTIEVDFSKKHISQIRYLLHFSYHWPLNSNEIISNQIILSKHFHQKRKTFLMPSSKPYLSQVLLLLLFFSSWRFFIFLYKGSWIVSSITKCFIHWVCLLHDMKRGLGAGWGIKYLLQVRASLHVQWSGSADCGTALDLLVSIYIKSERER